MTEEFDHFLKSEEKLTIESLMATRRELATSGRVRHAFYEELCTLDKQAEREGTTPEERLRLGAGWWVLGEPDRALEVLGHTLSTTVALFVTAKTHMQRGEYAEAVDRLSKAVAREPDLFVLQIGLAEALRRRGRTDEAKKTLDGLAKKHAKEPDLHYEYGVLQDMNGQYAEAMETYEKVLKLDPNHGKSLFRVASVYDRLGQDEVALDYYRKCCDLQPTYPSALINLGILCEDLGRFEEAMECYRKVLRVEPSHPRARMYLVDAKASMNMYYDEDQLREKDKRDQVLRTPVSDFELSVRSRNCLEKMNIRTLGDLISKDEAELLSYKNFGETSLVEIKELLVARGLSLGEGKVITDDDGDDRLSLALREMSDQLLEEPLSKLELTLRCEGFLAGLEIHTIGELVARTEAELLSIKSFGQTSLDEVRTSLAKRGLQLQTI